MSKPQIKVLMLRTAKGAPDSTTVKEYLEGQVYEIPEDLADCFFSDGSADPAEAHEPAPSPGDASGGGNSGGGDTSPPAEKPAPRKRRAKSGSSEAGA